MPITIDQLGRHTGRFGGVRWEPLQGWRSRGYVSGRWEEGFNSSNESKYGDFVPMLYGTAWIDPLVLNVVGDANLTAMELLLCTGEVESVLRVVVNDVSIAETGRGGDLVGGFWGYVNKGARDGAVNTNTFYDGNGDCYGSLATLEIRVPRTLASSNSVPRVRVLVRGPKLRVYSDATTYEMAYTESPAWVLLDLLQSAGWQHDEIDLASFVQAAAVCHGAVSFESQHGGTSLRDRFSTSLTVRQRRSAADLIRGVRNACRGVLYQDWQGLLRLTIKQTLADQQPALIDGSNYQTPVTSVTAAGTIAQGYAAYHFNDASILLAGGRSSLSVRQRESNDTPNHYRLAFQDDENSYEPDLLSEYDAEELVRTGQEVAQTPAVEGITSFDQGRRILGTLFAEAYRGNPRSDTGGTWQFEWESSVRASHLNIGQIVLLTSERLGISGQPVRLTRIQPSANFETVRLAGHWHEDEWYVDSFGQGNSPGYSSQGRQTESRPPFAWQPYHSTGAAGDPLSPAGEYTFGLTPKYEVAADGTAIAKVVIQGALPVNSLTSLTRPPFLPLQGTTSPTGGVLPGARTYWAALIAKDAAATGYYGCTAPSGLCRVDVPGTSNTNTITIPISNWAAGSAGYVLFAGTDPSALTYQDEADTNPASITLSGPLKSRQWGMPDSQFHNLIIRAKRIVHSGLIEARIANVTASSISIDDARWTVNQWAGYDCSVIGFTGSMAEAPLASFSIAGNTGDILTLSTGSPNPVALGVQPGDVVVIRSRPASSSATSITDTNWDNSLSLEPSRAITALSGGTAVTITVPGHGFASGDRIRVEDVGGLVNADGVVSITVLDSDIFVADGVSGGGSYISGGSVRRLTGGLTPNAEAGRLVRILAGTGRGQLAKIALNTPTEIMFESALTVALDQTSRYVIEEPEWLCQTESTAIDNYYAGVSSQWELECSNLANQPLLVQCTAVNAGGQESASNLSPVREAYFVGSTGETGSFRGGLAISVAGVLAIGSDLAPPLSFAASTRAQQIRLSVKQAPVGSDLIVSIYLNGVWYSTLAVPEGTKSGQTTKATTNLLPDIAEGALVRLDIVQVGTSFPGADLTCSIFT